MVCRFKARIPTRRGRRICARRGFHAYDNIGKAADGCKADWTRAQRAPRRGEGAMRRARINQTKVQTSTGIWEVTYNAENRPVTFDRSNEDGTSTRVTCAYDYMGRRTTKKVETISVPDAETGESSATTILHQRYIYRGYLQIAGFDLTESGHSFRWSITWDPTQRVATRPLAIRKEGTWYCYGWDLTKNVCEVFSNEGYLNNTVVYSYTPYGSVTASGTVTQPIQWSSEFYDDELGLVYYNYRHYNSNDGRWLTFDIIIEDSYNLYSFVSNNIIFTDYLGLTGKASSKCCKDGKQYKEVVDDANRTCCEYEIQEIAILVIPFGTKDHFVGHAWVKTPNVQKGFYPHKSSYTKGALWSVDGQIKDDSVNESLANPQNSYYFKACPESVSEVEAVIKNNESNVPKYHLNNDWNRNCCGWSCQTVEAAGFKAPFKPNTHGLAPASPGHRGYGSGRRPKK